MTSIADRIERDGGEQLSAIEIAGYFGVSRNTVYLWHRRGILPGGIKIGGTLRFDKAAVVAHLRSRQGGDAL